MRCGVVCFLCVDRASGSALIERCHFAQPQPVHEGYHHAVVVGSSVSSVFDSIGKRKLMGLMSLLAQHSGCAKGSEEEAAHVAASFARMASARQIPPGVLTLRDNVVDLPGCSIICPVALGQPCLHFDDACSALAAFERHQGIKCVTEVPLTATWPSLGGSFRAAREEWCLAGPFPTSSEAVWAEYCRVRREVERLSKLLATIQPSEEDLCDVDPDSHEADAELLQAANRRREKLLAARAPPDGSAQFFTLLLCLMRLGVHLPVELLMVIRRFATTPALPALSTLYVATNWEDVDMLRTVHAGTCLWTETGSCLVLEYSWHERARMTFCEMFEEVSLTAVPLTDVSSLLHFRASPHYQHRVHLMRYDDSQTHQVCKHTLSIKANSVIRKLIPPGLCASLFRRPLCCHCAASASVPSRASARESVQGLRAPAHRERCGLLWSLRLLERR